MRDYAAIALLLRSRAFAARPCATYTYRSTFA